MSRSCLLMAVGLAVVGCAGAVDTARVDLPTVTAAVETAPVASSDDAADDPAIWVNPADPAASVILGTDKQAGLYVYDLSGAALDFLPVGRLNNVDLRQDVAVGAWRGDIAAASNRSDDTIAFFVVETGEVRFVGASQSPLPEPYGLCLGHHAGATFVFVAYKTGDLAALRVEEPGRAVEVARLKLASQLEGCVYDDAAGRLYVGEENAGIWRVGFDGVFGAPQLVDRVGAQSGLVADVEGLTIYATAEGGGYLLASSQGDDSFAVYERSGDNRFIGRFRIADGVVDGAEETDGVAATSAALGDRFPNGALVVQDGLNAPAGETQNLKIVDWRDIQALIDLIAAR